MATLKPVRFHDADPSWPPLARAASLAVAIMSATKASTWGEVAERAEAEDPAVMKVELTPEQADLLGQWSAHLGLLQMGEVKVLLHVCPVCGVWGLQQNGAAPSRCTLTRRCTGKPVRTKAVTRVKTAVARTGAPSTGPT